MAKVLWCDTETTGVNAFKNGVIQIAGIVEIDGIEQESFDLKMNVFPQDEIDTKALEVHGMSLDTIASFPSAKSQYAVLQGIFDKYIDKFDRGDKFFLAGYNVGFDANMLQSYFRKNGNRYFYSYINGAKLDVLSMVAAYCVVNKLDLANHKLSTVASYFGITGDFHDALDDIKATKKIFQLISGSSYGNL